LQEIAQKLTLLKRVHCDIGGFDALHAGPYDRNCSIVLQRQLPGQSACIERVPERERVLEREYYKRHFIEALIATAAPPDVHHVVMSFCLYVCVYYIRTYMCVCACARARIYRDLCGSGKRARTVMLS